MRRFHGRAHLVYIDAIEYFPYVCFYLFRGIPDSDEAD